MNPPIFDNKILAQAPMEQLFHFMDLAVVFKTNDTQLMELAQQFFQYFPKSQKEQGFEVRLFRHPAPPDYRLTSKTPVFNLQDHQFSVTLDEWNQGLADLNTRVATAFLTPEVIANLPLVEEDFLGSMVFCSAHVLTGYPVLHTACVVKHDRGLALLGPSGRGKSTLSLTCAKQGFQLVSENSLYTELTPQGLRWWGKAWPCRLLPEALPFFPELQNLAPRLFSGGKTKIAVDPETFYPGSILTHTTPGALVLLERTSQKAYFQTLSWEEIAGHLEPIWPYDFPPPASAAQIKQELSRLPAYRLYLSGHPKESVALLEEISEEVCTR